MFIIVLYQPEVPSNMGNTTRLYVNIGVNLHSAKPLGFPLDSSKVRRAGLDYHEFTKLTVHENFEDCLKALEGRRIFALVTKGKICPDEASFKKDDVFLFGPETHGLPAETLDSPPAERKLRLSIRLGNRSINLSNTATVMLFKAWWQNDYQGGIRFPAAAGLHGGRPKSKQTLSTQERNHVLTFIRNTFLHHVLFIALTAFVVGMLPAAANAVDTVIRTEKLRSSTNLSYKVAGKRYTPLTEIPLFSQTGKASWYGSQFRNRKAASGECYDMNALTAVRRTLPIPNYVRVANTKDGKSVIVRVNDRDPSHGSRMMDMSKATAQKLDFISRSTAHIKIEQVLPGNEAVMSGMSKRDIYVDLKSFGSEGEALTCTSRTGHNLSSADIVSEVLVEKRGDSYVVRIGPFAAQERANEAENRARVVVQNVIWTALWYGMPKAV